jgi:hypothetical protein
MPFNVARLNEQLLLDNPTYERFVRSDLHTLIEMLRQTPARWTPAMVAAEMKKVSADKWLKYARTRGYLEVEISTLKRLLRATPTGFRTTSMSSRLDNTYLRHTFRWVSDTGSLQDLAATFTREKVTWPQWPLALLDCIGDDDLYKSPGQHTGLAANPASMGGGTDDHALLGPFSQKILSYRGVAVSAPMDQVYEYSYDSVNWLPIPDSTFKIVRELTGLTNGRVQLSITKTNKTNPRDSFVVRRIFSL